MIIPPGLHVRSLFPPGNLPGTEEPCVTHASYQRTCYQRVKHIHRIIIPPGLHVRSLFPPGNLPGTEKPCVTHASYQRTCPVHTGRA